MRTFSWVGGDVVEALKTPRSRWRRHEIIQTGEKNMEACRRNDPYHATGPIAGSDKYTAAQESGIKRFRVLTCISLVSFLFTFLALCPRLFLPFFVGKSCESAFENAVGMRNQSLGSYREMHVSNDR